MAFSKNEFRHNSINPRYARGGEIGGGKLTDKIKVRYIEEDKIHTWTIGEAIDRINEDSYASEDNDLAYNTTDWLEGWDDAIEGEFYSLNDKNGKPLNKKFKLPTYAEGGDIPKGYHKMPDGTIMADSGHYAKGGEIKYSKDGYVKEIRDWNGKVIKELLVNGKKYRRNAVYGTYNSIDGNELLHKNNYKSDSTYARGGGVDGKTSYTHLDVWTYSVDDEEDEDKLENSNFYSVVNQGLLDSASDLEDLIDDGLVQHDFMYVQVENDWKVNDDIYNQFAEKGINDRQIIGWAVRSNNPYGFRNSLPYEEDDSVQEEKITMDEEINNAINHLQDKIKSQGMITDARDEERLKSLLRMKEMRSMKKGGGVDYFTMKDGSKMSKDEWYQKMEGKLGFEKFAERILKDSQFGRYANAPHNLFHHNTRDVQAQVFPNYVNLTIEDIGEDDEDRWENDFYSLKELDDYLNENQILANGGGVDVEDEVATNITKKTKSDAPTLTYSAEIQVVDKKGKEVETPIPTIQATFSSDLSSESVKDTFKQMIEESSGFKKGNVVLIKSIWIGDIDTPEELRTYLSVATEEEEEEFVPRVERSGKWDESYSVLCDELASWEMGGDIPSESYSWGGGIAVGSLIGGYLGYKVGRMRPQKHGFETEKKIGRKIGRVASDLRRKKPKKAYADGGGVDEFETALTIKPHHASRSEFQELLDYLDDNNIWYTFSQAPNHELDYIQVSAKGLTMDEVSDFTNYLDRNSWDYEIEWVDYEKGGMMPLKNPNKHLWEGWTNEALMLDILPTFNMIMQGKSWRKPFKTKQEVADFVNDEQPNFKRYNKDVIDFFWGMAQRYQQLQDKFGYAEGGEVIIKDKPIHVTLCGNYGTDDGSRIAKEFILRNDLMNNVTRIYGDEQGRSVLVIDNYTDEKGWSIPKDNYVVSRFFDKSNYSKGGDIHTEIMGKFKSGTLYDDEGNLVTDKYKAMNIAYVKDLKTNPNKYVYAEGGTIGDRIIYNKGRYGEQEGTITREVDRDNWEVWHGMGYSMVNKNDVIGLAPEKKKRRFGLFADGGSVSEITDGLSRKNITKIHIVDESNNVGFEENLPVGTISWNELFRNVDKAVANDYEIEVHPYNSENKLAVIVDKMADFSDDDMDVENANKLIRVLLA
jgi:hypothetical protein